MTEFGTPRRTTYHVTGPTLQAVADAISHLPEAGRADWTPSFEEAHDDAGTVTSATVRCGLAIQMPVWTDYPSASQAAKDEWDRWWVALEAHEQGHLDIVTQELAALEDQMVGRTIAEARAAFDTAVAQTQACSDAYDASTNHGVSAGTVLDTTIP